MEDFDIMNHPTGANFMSNDIELLACPFCGGIAMLQEHPAHTHMVATFMPDHPGSATVECTGCNAGMINDTVAQVTADWNTRAALAAPQQEPVAWNLPAGAVIDSQSGDWSRLLNAPLRVGTKVYTASPPAAPVLSDGEIDQLILEFGIMNQWPTQKQCHAFARALLAKVTKP